jgi:transposase
MAGKPKPMSQIKQLLRLHQMGWKVKAIARTLAVSKNTVKSYLRKVFISKWVIAELLCLEDPVLEAKFHAGNPAYKDMRYEQLKDKLDYYARELRRTGVTKLLLWDEYQQDYPNGYGRSQFCYHLLKHVRTSKPSMVLTHKPGDKLFVDFAGKRLSYIDRSSGEIMEVQVFVACLPYSDYGFAIAVPSQRISDFIYALTCCLIALGGVPGLIVPDNMKSAIVRASRYEPDVNRVLEDFANHYGTAVLPARAAHPKDKALVENQVKLLYNRVYARLRNRQFFSLAELNEAIGEKLRIHNQTRMQEKPYCREESFLAEEKSLLGPLPDNYFEIKSYREYTVRLNNHIKLSEDKHYYSIPYQYTGKKVVVNYTRTMVRIYAQGKQIAAHPRSYKPGHYTTQPNHLCSTHKHYLKRSPVYYLSKAQSTSSALYRLFELIFGQDRHPEQLYGTCDGLLNIYRKTDHQKADKACNLAIEHENYSYRFILNILSNNMIDQPEVSEEKPLPEHQNIRGKDYYQQLTLNF